jgi:hypothetical protein
MWKYLHVMMVTHVLIVMRTIVTYYDSDESDDEMPIGDFVVLNNEFDY